MRTRNLSRALELLRTNLRSKQPLRNRRSKQQLRDALELITAMVDVVYRESGLEAQPAIEFRDVWRDSDAPTELGDSSPTRKESNEQQKDR